MAIDTLRLARRWREADTDEDKVEALEAELDEYASRADLEVLRAQGGGAGGTGTRQLPAADPGHPGG